MGLLRRFIRHDLAELHQQQRARAHHRRARRARSRHRRLLDEAEELTARQYRRSRSSSPSTTAPATRSRAPRAALAERGGARARSRPTTITAELLGAHLDTPDMPDPDLIIRTSGEQRLSNFLLWQAAYSELVFVPIYWPDFDRAALEDGDRRISPARAPVRRTGGANRIVTP